MVTINDIKNLNSALYGIKVMHNTGVLLDPYLCDRLSPDTAVRQRIDNRSYDFDVFLPDYGVNLQRPYVWTPVQQSEFLTSMLQEKPLESVVVIERTIDITARNYTCVIEVIDGKQRLLTIKKFLDGEIGMKMNGRTVFFSEFDKEAKFFFRHRANSIIATVYYCGDDIPMTDAQKIQLFNYYNFSGTPQTEDHKNMLRDLLK